jgi:uncharacterized membrane protein YeiH
MFAVADTSSGAFLAIAVIGTIAFAVSGVLAAADAGMDWLGAVALGAVVAVGGGTIRDLLLGIAPVSWIDDEWPVVVAILTSIGCLVILRIRPTIDVSRRWWYVIADAVGLASFVVLGASIAEAEGASAFVVVLMGVVTGVGGGVIRDVFTGRRPIVFVGEIYAMAGVVGALLFVALDAAEATSFFVVWLPTVVVVALRVAAVRLDLHLPKAALSRADDD